ncbi:MAG: prolyl oligopeptidase family serine peptidase [Microlunatus sp.]|nr:prolyl oligopeptidase family serine peptidase [Microlunatus sp.]MDN5771210.1 prolyl oligopeptidase family serine peptidase [Microlunatus sp.]
MDYPVTRCADLVETLHGRQIADPYRWLESPDDPETVDWVKRQNEVTETYLSSLPERDWFKATMRSVLHRPRAGVPFCRGGRYVVSRNDGHTDQDVWYVADSLAELRTGGRVLIDPNRLSDDGLAALQTLTISENGRLAAFGVSDSGSDWQRFQLQDLTSGQSVTDAEITTKFCAAEWLPDGRSYLYLDFGHAGDDGTGTAMLPGGRLKIHRIGDPAEADRLVLAFPENDQIFLHAQVTADHRYVTVTITEGTDSCNRLWLYPLHQNEDRWVLDEPIKVMDQPVAELLPIEMVAGRLYLQTDLDAPRGRIVWTDPTQPVGADGLPELTEVYRPGSDTLLAVEAAGEGMAAAILVDVTPVVEIVEWDGTLRHRLDLDGGSLVALNGRHDDDELFVGLSSVTSPASAYRVDASTGSVEPLPELLPRSRTEVPAPAITVKRGRAISADGTVVPYFFITPDGWQGPGPTLMYGYGGFRIPIFADYRPGWTGWLAAGGALVIANLRGGGEFGTQWYHDGRLDKKQNVFDDAIAVAQDLIGRGVTTAAQLAVEGRSNGGLLVGALITQRPDLFAAAVTGVGVLDLLRFHLFTVGAAWTSDFGDPDDPSDFEAVLAYSPLHAITPGTRYPATLVLTGDHDDRVVPLHSHKFTATLQAAQAGEAPVLTRIETATGHGAGKPASLVAAEWADVLAFCAQHTGLVVPPRHS